MRRSREALLLAVGGLRRDAREPESSEKGMRERRAGAVWPRDPCRVPITLLPLKSPGLVLQSPFSFTSSYSGNSLPNAEYAKTNTIQGLIYDKDVLSERVYVQE